MKSIAHSDSAVNRNVGESRVVEGCLTVSPALAAANRRLLAARQHKNQRNAPRSAPRIASISAESTQIPDAMAAALPAHLGWHNAAFVHVKSRQPNTLRIVNKANPFPLTQKQSDSIANPTNQQSNQPTTNPTITAYPSLLAAMLKADAVAAGRVWLLCRAIDRDGRGWLDVDEVRWRLVGNGRWRKQHETADASFALFGWRRLRQILQQGRGVFWSRDKRNRLWLHGAARVAEALGVERLAGRPIALPMTALTDSAAMTRAHFYAAFHSGRPATRRGEFATPISRQTLENVTHVPARTQRQYDRMTGIKRKQSLAIGARYSAEKLQETAWERQTGAFAFIDHHGRQGDPGRHYIAWQLPNVYRGCHVHARRGRSKKINQELAIKQAKERQKSIKCHTGHSALVEKRERGNGITQCTERIRMGQFAADASQKPVAGRLFHHTARQAVATASSGRSGYWRHQVSADYVLWQPVATVEEKQGSRNN
jgi:hypothetical protein